MVKNEWRLVELVVYKQQQPFTPPSLLEEAGENQQRGNTFLTHKIPQGCTATSLSDRFSTHLIDSSQHRDEWYTYTQTLYTTDLSAEKKSMAPWQKKSTALHLC